MLRTDPRRTPRYPFLASAEVTDTRTANTISQRTTELSRFGCYIDTPNPFPIASKVNITILHQEEKFEAAGRVVYAQKNKGMGVAFDSAKLESAAILEKWLASLSDTSRSGIHVGNAEG